jgi:hypothetical protein
VFSAPWQRDLSTGACMTVSVCARELGLGSGRVDNLAEMAAPSSHKLFLKPNLLCKLLLSHSCWKQTEEIRKTSIFEKESQTQKC